MGATPSWVRIPPSPPDSYSERVYPVTRNAQGSRAVAVAMCHLCAQHPHLGLNLGDPTVEERTLIFDDREVSFVRSLKDVDQCRLLVVLAEDQ